jgi:hypothetical protein
MSVMALRSVVLAVVASLLATCTPERSQETAVSPSPVTTPPSPTETSPSPSPSPEVEAATVGTWIRGDNGRINVRELEVPAVPNREVVLSPGAGNTFAAIQVAACPKMIQSS